ncbi:MAG: MFS transporter, partial [Pseudomonadota bacterium]
MNGSRAADAGVSDAARLGLMYGAVFFAYGLHGPYLGVWLASRGLTPDVIGIILSVPLLIRLVVSPSVGLVADRTGRHGALVLLLASVSAVAAAMLAIVTGPLAMGLAVAVMLATLQSALPLVEVIALRRVRSGAIDYGRVRLWGSWTFVAATLIGGAAVERLTASALGPLFVLAGFGTAMAA